MIIKRILIVDHENAESGEYTFGNKANLIISKSNSQGKSSLIKSIYYGLGFKINKFPTGWDISKMSIKLSLFNEITGEDLYVIRHENLYYVSGKDDPLSSTEYTRWLSGQLDINLKLKNKSSDEVASVAYPSALIVPFYIDQDDSWSGRLFASTNELTMYEKVPDRIFEYVLGISDDEEMKLSEKISKKQKQHSNAKAKHGYIKNAFLDYIENDNFNSNIVLTESLDSFSKQSIDNLISLINTANKKYMGHKTKRIKLQRIYDQKRKSEAEYRSILKMYEDDYKQIKAKCKHCKSELTIEQVQTRMDISSNVSQLKMMIASIKKDIDISERKVHEAHLEEKTALEEYRNLSGQIRSVPEIKSLNDYISQASKKRSQEEFAKIIQTLETEVGKLEIEIRELKLEEKELKSNIRRALEDVKSLYERYVTQLSLLMPKSDINKISFKKFTGLQSSGVIGNQTYFGIYLVYMRLVSELGRYKLPFCIDSFIKNETDCDNLDKMFEATEKYLLNQESQTIFSAIQDSVDKYIEHPEKYNCIILGDRLLSAANYQDDLQEIMREVQI